MGSDWELPINVVSFLGSSPLFSCSGPVISTPVPDGPKVPEALVAPIWVQCPGVGEPASLGTAVCEHHSKGPDRTGPGNKAPALYPIQPNGGWRHSHRRAQNHGGLVYQRYGCNERGACPAPSERARKHGVPHLSPIIFRGVLDPLSLSRPEIPALVALAAPRPRAGGGSAANFLPWLGSSRAAHMNL